MPRTYRRKAKSDYIRVTDDQKRMFEETAARLGLDVSSWVRSLSIREAKRLAVEDANVPGERSPKLLRRGGKAGCRSLPGVRGVRPSQPW